MRTYKLIPKNKKYSETSAYVTPPASSIQKNKRLDETIFDADPEEFTGPKDAIKWCNEKFKELGDKKFKQISQYLHIYL